MMRIIPAIDIIGGKCVRLAKGDYTRQKIYGNPLEIALDFEANGIKYLHLVDLDGAKAKKVINLKILESIATRTDLIIDFGGGINSRDDLENVFNAGAAKVTLGSLAVRNPELCTEWLKEFGAGKLILGADCLNRKIKTSGWLEDSQIDVIDFINRNVQEGFTEVICTDISKDGMLEGPSFNLYGEILKQTTVDLIASGGITSVADLKALRNLGCAGAIIGKAIYEGRITLTELQKFN